MTPELGNCPLCHDVIHAEEGTLPTHCPNCNYQLRTTRPDFIPCVVSCLRKYATFSGRARRSEYWWFSLFFCLLANFGASFLQQIMLGACLHNYEAELKSLENIQSVKAFMDQVMLLPTDFIVSFSLCILLPFIVSMALFLPSLSVTVRRLHDTGRSGVIACIIYSLQFVLPFIIAGAAIYIANIAQNDAGPLSDQVQYLIAGIVISLLLVLFLLFIGIIYLLVCLLLDSHRGPNKYGPSPKYPIA